MIAKADRAELLGSSARGKRVPPSRRAGVSGVPAPGGYLEDGEKRPELHGPRKFKTYSELIANVSIVAACVRLYLELVGKAGWIVEPAKDSGREGEKIAELVEAILYDLERPWSRVVKRAAMYRPIGFSWQEWIAKRRPDGLVGFLDIEPRSQSTIERWDVDEEGIVHGVWQVSPHDFRESYLPRSKAVYIADDSISDSPEGLGILRHAAPDAMRLQAYERLEGIGFETDLRGIPVGRVPYSTLDAMVKDGKITKEQAEKWAAPIEGFVTDHKKAVDTGLVIDSAVYRTIDESASPSGQRMFDVSLLSAGNTSQEAAAAAIARLVRSLARLFGCEGLLLGENGAGSLAMAKDKSSTLGLVVDGALVDIAEQFEHDLLPPLARMNGWNPELLPTLKTEKLQHRDVLDIVDSLERMARAGAPIMPDDEVINAVRRLLGLPEVDLSAIDLDASLRAGRGLPDGDSAEELDGELPKEQATTDDDLEDED